MCLKLGFSLGVPCLPLPCFISLLLLSPAFLCILSPEVGWEKPGQDTHWAVLATVDRRPVPGTPGAAPRDGSAPFSIVAQHSCFGEPTSFSLASPAGSSLAMDDPPSI